MQENWQKYPPKSTFTSRSTVVLKDINVEINLIVFNNFLLFLDFEKAFDTLEWSFIQKALISFGFGLSIVQWFKTFYNNTESCIMNNGWASNFFSFHRGVRQGCRLSPLPFYSFSRNSGQSNPETCRHKRFIS